jgi:TldD protein
MLNYRIYYIKDRRSIMIEKNLVADMLCAATAGGAEFAEVFCEKKDSCSLSLINGKVDSTLAGIDFGVGIRIIDGDKMVYLYTNKKDESSLIKLAKNGALALSGTADSHIMSFNEVDYSKNSFYLPQIMPTNIDKSLIVDKLSEGSKTAFAYSKFITQTGMGYLHSIQDVIIANTEGVFARDKRVRTRVTVNAVASNANEKQTGYFGPGAMMGFEFFENLNIDELSAEAARSAVTMLCADNCPSGKMPVIMDNGFGGVIFHEACGHGLEAAAVSKNASVFANKLGQQIASRKVTAIDDGTIASSWGSINVDDEGIAGKKNILIKDGILNNYMVDRFNGKVMGIKPTGSSRRQNYKYIPVSRMTNTYIAAGTDKPEDIIASTKYGLYAKYMGGGSVNPASGEFNFAVNEAYIVRNGKICEPVRGATLIGKGSEVLMNIDMVGDNLKLAEGMCGASSGSVPVCVGQPMIRVNDITVGGR